LLAEHVRHQHRCYANSGRDRKASMFWLA